MVPGTSEKAGSEENHRQKPDVRALGGKAIAPGNMDSSFKQSRCASSSTGWFISKRSAKGSFVGIGTFSPLAVKIIKTSACSQTKKNLPLERKESDAAEWGVGALR